MAEPLIAILGLNDNTNVGVRRSSSTTESAAPGGETRASASGPGRVIETEHDMPALEALLEAHKVKTAILISSEPATDRDGVTTSLPLPSGWRQRARLQIDRALSELDGNAAIDDEFAFLAVLDGEALDSFLAEASMVLDRVVTTESKWERFLASVGRQAYQGFGHTSLAPLDQDLDESDGREEPLYGLDDLGVSFERGAFGSPRPLVERNPTDANV